MADPVVEVKSGVVTPEVEEVKPDAEGKYPETVAWKQYVGIKESLGKKLDTAKAKVTELEEQAKKATSPEELTSAKEELEGTKTKLQEVTTELKTTQDKTLTEKRATLVSRGVPEDKVKDMSEKELDSANVVLEATKPKADLGGGGGGDAPISAKAKMGAGFEMLHPSK